MNKPFLTLVGLAALSLLAPAQVTQSGGLVTFRTKFTQGATIRYNIASTVAMPGATRGMMVALPVTQKVQSVRNGVATLRVTSGPMMMNNQPMSQPQSVTIQMDRTGRVVGNASPQAANLNPIPRKPVRIGETWSGTVPLGAGAPGMGSAKATYRLLGFSTEGSRRFADISITFDASGANAFKGSGKGRILASDGTLWSMNINIDGSASMAGASGGTPQAQQMKIVVRVTRS